MVLQLALQGAACNVLEVHVDAADHIVPGDRLHDVIVRNRHPLSTGHAALQLTTGHAGELFIPASFEAHALLVPVDADGSSREVPKWLPTLLDAVKREAAFESATANEWELSELFLLDVGDATSDQGVAASQVATFAEDFAVFARGFVAQHLTQPFAQCREFAVKRIPINGLALAVPANFEDRDGCGEHTAVRGVDLSAGRSDGLHAGFEAFSHLGPLLVFSALDP